MLSPKWNIYAVFCLPVPRNHCRTGADRAQEPEGNGMLWTHQGSCTCERTTVVIVARTRPVRHNLKQTPAWSGELGMKSHPQLRERN